MPKGEPSQPTATPRTRGRVVVAGASGLIGAALVESLRADGIEVQTLVRRPPRGAHEHEWLTAGAPLDPAVLAGADAVIGLGGASIGRVPWTPAYQRELVDSRILPTSMLARAVRALGQDAPTFVSASAVGAYGSRPGVVLDESSPRGTGFMADLVAQWEAAALTAGDHARIVQLRTAPVVHQAGVLAPLLLLTRLGLSGPLGPGTQAWPWISLTDEVRAIRHILDSDLSGPVNLTGPNRATANDLGFALAVALNRPFLIRAPAFALRTVLGRAMADGLLLADADVRPAALLASGFTFSHPTVEDAVAAAVEAIRAQA